MLPNAPHPNPPLVDLTVLAHLEQQFNDAGPARAFARDYIAGFGDRCLRLTRSVADQDLPAALEAALSLRNSSLMLGAERLVALTAAFEAAISSADLDAARRALPGIERCGLDTIRELETRYLDPA
ncbi:Hpt domain-containing protein [Arthrobacter antioxidans]|uniref:Hpt domain-containing protein n=1 Tax=Arthrobacter antioxidans TaxID=2895818 RepID=UPI001FFFA0ED|nr:Hpt domain-containing protein [Arthrobacter antioxidans]